MLRLWNALDLTVRNSATLLEFKTNFRNQIQKDKASDILSIGEKKNNIISTMSRDNCSNLNADIHRLNVVPSPLCICSAKFEMARHYLFE